MHCNQPNANFFSIITSEFKGFRSDRELFTVKIGRFNNDCFSLRTFTRSRDFLSFIICSLMVIESTESISVLNLLQ